MKLLIYCNKLSSIIVAKLLENHSISLEFNNPYIVLFLTNESTLCCFSLAILDKAEIKMHCN